MAMLGGGDTSGSVLGSSGGVGTGGGVGAAAVSSSGGRDGTTSEAAAAATTMIGSNGNNNSTTYSNNSGEDRVDELGERSFGGNRWPRQETLALLKIRSDMDVTFRDASVKGPLWEEVSRKLAELGYHRSAKKCREKFENVYKYHKRTKDGRTGKSDGKTYRFFDQLEALLNHTSIQSPPPPVAAAPPQLKPQLAPPEMPAAANPPMSLPAHVRTVPSNTAPANINITAAPPFCSVSADLMSNSTSSSTSSDLELEGGRRKRKRKWKDFFERLTKEMTRKQEEMQKRFLEAIEKRERERTVREESWRMQEMTRLNREGELLAQERSIAAAKDAAVMAFLQKLSDNNQQQNNNNNIPLPPSQQQPPPPPQAPPEPAAAPPPPAVVKLDVVSKSIDNGAISSSRWPKVEVLALIRLRTELDVKYHDSGPKGPLWEDISAEMKKLGYNRNAKRCKEKWENINKYFKKVKESNKKRADDSKTCPYFHELEALHRQKKINNNVQLKPEINSVPLMVRPEQQWPPAEEDPESDQNQDDVVVEGGDDAEEEDDDEEGDGGGFEIVASKPVSMRTGE